MNRTLVTLLFCAALAACIPKLDGAPCTTHEECPADQFCAGTVCAVGPRTGGGTGGGDGTGGGTATGGGTSTGGGTATGGGDGSGGGTTTGGGSATGGGTTTGGGDGTTGGGAATGGGEPDAGVDTEPPLVIATTPTSGSMSVSINTDLEIVFSESMRQMSVLYLASNVSFDGGVWNTDSTRLTLRPTAPLSFDTAYNVSVTGQDLAGNFMAAQYSYAFRTEATPDTTPPSIESTEPPDGGVNVPTTAELLVTFSEPMNPASLDVEATPPLNFAAPIWSGDNRQLSISSSAPMSASTTYAISIEARDVAGNALPVGSGFTFTTAAPPDTTPPTLVSTTPTAGNNATPNDSVLRLTFSEPMNINSLVLTPDPDPGLGAPTWTTGNAEVTFAAPDGGWGYSTQYEVEITGFDLAGNALTTPSLKFKIEPEPDTTPPTVTSTAPATGSMSVPYTGNIEFNFSEPMNEADTQAALISSPNINCSFTWNAAKTLMVCNPVADLAANTNYTLTLGVGAKDLAGLPLAAPYALSFRTAAAPDTTRPTITSTNPTHGEVGVPRTVLVTSPRIGYGPRPISVTFSEPMSQASVQGAFSITSPTGFNGGSFRWSGNTMTYTPPAAFDYGQVVNFQISTGATDLAGNSLASTASVSYRVRRRNTANFYATSAQDSLQGYTSSTTACGSPTASVGSTVAAAGDRTNTYAPIVMWRGFMTFSIASLASLTDVNIVSAYLYATQVSCTGNPYTTTFGSAIEAWHVNYGATFEAADCNSSNLGGRQYTLSKDTVLEVKSVLVTDAVEDDYANRSARGSRSQFRIQTANAATDNDTFYDYCNFATNTASTTTNRPYLRITYEYD